MAKKRWLAVVAKLSGQAVVSPDGVWYIVGDGYGAASLVRRIARLLNADDAAKVRRKARK